jgi:hypothetical protein
MHEVRSCACLVEEEGAMELKEGAMDEWMNE